MRNLDVMGKMELILDSVWKISREACAHCPTNFGSKKCRCCNFHISHSCTHLQYLCTSRDLMRYYGFMRIVYVIVAKCRFKISLFWNSSCDAFPFIRFERIPKICFCNDFFRKEHLRELFALLFNFFSWYLFQVLKSALQVSLLWSHSNILTEDIHCLLFIFLG